MCVTKYRNVRKLCSIWLEDTRNRMRNRKKYSEMCNACLFMNKF